jgi:hypothetical protein
MGIDQDGLSFLRFARRQGVDFSDTCTIGRQRVTAFGAPAFCEPLLERELGARCVDSLDHSSYEGATILHDLNLPTVPSELQERYSVVLDGGSLEHVFDVPAALRTMMSMVRDGGHLLLINPMDGHAGHGFYQFGPELYMRALSPAQGFRVEWCLLRTGGIRRRWYQLSDPAEVGRRIEPRSMSAVYLYVIANKHGPTPERISAQQSDYQEVWQDASPARSGHRLRTIVPAWAQPLGSSVTDAVARLAGPRGPGIRRIDLDGTHG